MTDNTENLFDENGNIQDVFMGRTVEELEALFPQMEPEPALAHVEPTNPADELIENRIVLQERIYKLNELIDNRDTHGFNEAVISAFNDELSELKDSLKEIDSVLVETPENEENKRILENIERSKVEKQLEEEDFQKKKEFRDIVNVKDVEAINNIDLSSMNKEELSEFIKFKSDEYDYKYSSYSDLCHDFDRWKHDNDPSDKQVKLYQLGLEHDGNICDSLLNKIEEAKNLHQELDNINSDENVFSKKEQALMDELSIDAEKIKSLDLRKMSEADIIEFIDTDVKERKSRVFDNGLIVASHHFYDDDVVMKATKWKEHDTEMLEVIKNKTESELSRRKELESVFSITSDTKPLKTVGELKDEGIQVMTLRKSKNLKQRLSQTRDRIASNVHENENVQPEVNEVPWYKKIGDVVDYFADGLKGSSNAKPVFLSEDKIYDTFGDEIDKIINRSKTRIIHFKDKTSVLESAQEIKAKGKNYNTVSEKMSKLAIAKGWKSITFEGSDVFLGVAYEKATRLGLVVEPQNAEQEELFKGIHKAKGLDEIMPFSGMKKEEVNNKEIDVPEVRATQGQRMRM
ncbi:LPD7 domain-containing protein [Citrobacter braakii]|uniref:LPD7 domain-containing protein n=1 Tax=Citrobacter braakii TaxID=57706 RepID=UPI0028BF248E|nr:LPD7 domain-containing protein [Citrobacter braakii]MDT7062952.1 LPD7 domain-containing protein [Citrobacter braakii]